MSIPTRALSIRQPWAWAIIHAGKDVENRSWQAINHGLNVRGRIAVHASQSMSKGHYEVARDFMAALGVCCPEPASLPRGGIIGQVEVLDVVSESDSGWFVGPRGLLLANPEPCDFVPVKGVLGFFDWRKRLTTEIVEPARWMLPDKYDGPKQASFLENAHE